MAFRLPPPPTAGQPSQNIDTLNNYLNLRNSYLDMISKPTTHDQSSSDPAAPALVPPPVIPTIAATAPSEASPFLGDSSGGDDAFRELIELLTPDWTPQLGGAGMNDSPPEETPLFTPSLDMFGTPLVDTWTSPAMGDADSFDAFPPLFNDAFSGGYADPATLHKKNHHDAEPMTIDDQTQLFIMPQTPSLAPSSMLPPTSSRPIAGTKNATGFRKGSNPATMIPIDAPTQTRSYLGASKTSRKEVPAAFQTKAKKRQRELDEDDVPDDIQDQIAAKRRLNTLAARRSRQRKAQTALEMETRIADLTAQLELAREQIVAVTSERDAYKAQLGYL